jgi:flagellar basal body-associated protein FliL
MEEGPRMRREIPIAVVVVILIAVVAIIGYLFYRGTQPPPPQEVNPLTGLPVEQTPKAPTPEHGTGRR